MILHRRPLGQRGVTWDLPLSDAPQRRIDWLDVPLFLAALAAGIVAGGFLFW